MTCCFFGHRDTPRTVEKRVENCVEELIAEGVDTFLVGNEGDFDHMVYRVLCRLRNRYPHMKCAVVLAYLNSHTEAPVEDRLFPEGMETVFPRYAIDRRNRWMLGRADVVVSYVRVSTGGAARFSDLADRRGIRVIRLGNN